MSTSRTDGYAGLRDYAVIGNMQTVALVATDGAVDWFPAPTLDSPPVCCAILDPDLGGSIGLAPTVGYQVSRRYREGTLVLETTFTTEGGQVRVTDALSLGALGVLPWTELTRLVEVVSGQVPMGWHVRPGIRFGSTRPWSHLRDGVPMVLLGDQHLALVTEGVGQPCRDEDGVSGRFVARPGQAMVLAVVATDGEPVHVPSGAEVRGRLQRTAERWRQWSDLVSYQGPWRDIVVRSALTLKALTRQSTGAIAGAATTSLPEQIGGRRNFDYRFSWVRDASFALDAVSRLGLSEETHAGLSWLLDAVSREAPGLRVFYTLAGAPASAEMQQVDRLAGYRLSTPVHAGNSAASQLQLGAYGDLLDAAWHYVRHSGRLDAATGALLAAMADRVCDIWRCDDAGLWELGSYQQYTSSKIGCWTALDRAWRLGEEGQIRSLHHPRWLEERDRVRAWVDQHCWSSPKQAYTFYAGTEELDAAVLLAARTGFCSGDDPRLHTTIDAIRAELTAGGPLLYRYSGQQGKEGAFLACSCWLVEALTHAGRLGEARSLLDGFVQRANDVGLYTEEMDPVSGELLGNMPQALTHLAVIGAATALTEALGARG